MVFCLFVFVLMYSLILLWSENILICLKILILKGSLLEFAL